MVVVEVGSGQEAATTILHTTDQISKWTSVIYLSSSSESSSPSIDTSSTSASTVSRVPSILNLPPKRSPTSSQESITAADTISIRSRDSDSDSDAPRRPSGPLRHSNAIANAALAAKLRKSRRQQNSGGIQRTSRNERPQIRRLEGMLANSEQGLYADYVMSSNEVARRSLQPHLRRERLSSLGDSRLHKTLNKERRHSLGDRNWIHPAATAKNTAMLNQFQNYCKMPRLREVPPSLAPLKESTPSVPVIILRGACKGYGRRSARKLVLNNLNMTVNRGQIYGLLGASGCGKTTLLSCVVGRRHLDSGMMSIFGGLPGDGICGIPGPRIGYMPQELALYGEFTIRETAEYFGRIYAMSPKQIKAQLEFLVALLDLPVDSRCLSTFSGGQQRRVSFLVSLLPDPELLILDEPTVGVDPLLRQNIWNHLVLLASQRQKTILITTHYIEEAKQAGRVGMMRSGRLLAEDSPRSLLSTFMLTSLEDVFLKLCVKESTGGEDLGGKHANGAFLEAQMYDKRASLGSSQTSTGSAYSMQRSDTPLNPLGASSKDDIFDKPQKLRCKCSLFSPSNFFALLMKNFLKLRRNMVMLSFVFLLPAIQVVFFCVAIGREPSDLPLAYVNQESNCSNVKSGCDFSDLSCRLTSSLSHRGDYIRYENLTEAHAGVVNGSLWGLIVFPANFSAAYVARMTAPAHADQAIINQSSLLVQLDMSNQQIALTVQNQILSSFDNFTRSLLRECRFAEEAASLPITWGDPIYGTKEPSFTEFMAPGIIILIIYFLAVALTGESFISERASGLLDRSWVAGVQPSEILSSHIVAQFLVMLVQTFITLAVIIWGFKIPCKGPVGWLAFLTVLQGLAGMCFGFLISALCDSQAVAMQLSIGSFYPNLLLSGILWPLEGMPYTLRVIAKFLPNTLACTAMRNIMLRGWDIDQQDVWLGVVATSIWIVIFFLLSWITVRVRS